MTKFRDTMVVVTFPLMLALANAGACPSSPDSVVLLWMARCDVSEPNAVQAHIIWEGSGCQMTPEYVMAILKYLGHQHSDVRLACADALAVGLLVRPHHLAYWLQRQVLLAICRAHSGGVRAPLSPCLNLVLQQRGTVCLVWYFKPSFAFCIRYHTS